MRLGIRSIGALWGAVALLACAGHSPLRETALGAPLPAFDAFFQRFLARYSAGDGRIDYAAAARDRGDLDAAVARLRAVSPDSDPLAFPSEAERLAYWINAYNVSAIRLVLDHYPIASVQDVRAPLPFLPAGAGFFYFQRVELGGRRTNLYDLENRLIRKRFADPRIHFALNCASLGCPELPPEPFAAARLEKQLARETRRFLSDPRKLRVDLAQRVVWVSPIFEWYERDFTRWVAAERPALPDTLLSWLRTHAPESQPLQTCADCRVDFLPYDWSLNDARDLTGR